MPRGDLFPDIAPYETGLLPLSGGHVMYWEQVGNPRGQPVLFLHGGPGAGAGAVHRRFFDPGHWRVVIFDQRGAGRSRPLGELRDNTTPHLVADIETLRRFLGIERWLLFGGSWGSTLALAYAQAHPDRVAGCVLRGVFLGRRDRGGVVPLRPAPRLPRCLGQPSPSTCPEAERGDLLAAYLTRLCDPDPLVHLPAARAWSQYEGSCSTLLPSPETVASFAQDRTALGLARIEAHYFAHDLFLPEGGLLGAYGPHRAYPGRDRAGPLRHGLPARDRLRTGRRLAARAADGGAGCRAFGAGAGGADGAGGAVERFRRRG